MRSSNHLIGVLNFTTFLLSIPIIGGGIWLSSRANNTDCLKFLQWPLIVIGVSIMVVSLAGFAGACYRNTFLMWVYLFVMFFIIAALIGFIIFAYAVTDKGSGRALANQAYKDYYLEDYSGWLEERVAKNSYWRKIASCVRDSKVCKKMDRTVNGVPETAAMFYNRKLNSIESGCCKPPTECGYTYVNETFWTTEGGSVGTNPDCSMWNNDQQELCYSCNSCKAGVLASIRKSWRKVSVINIVVLIVLVIFYVIGCAAFRNNRRIDNDEPYGEARMTKAQPSPFQL
ncbi:putative tetraspanin/Peripherin [Rosa chinensis]|uniref:Putative tetraspanin/Peripherin n=1 Tax=Rosa chinensis TaxID=74649 RepID=A0A2P6QHT7_ROSCH|nr:tetraspanin-3 [Rosa chinensis]PRQ33745.1 putative tetraspanin/Peripherin [Rosa chinensis]